MKPELKLEMSCMWSLKILNGPQAGKTFQLKEGENLVGRTPECQVIILSSGISKRHAKIIISGQKFSVVDLQSSNGTFVNGVHIQSRILNITKDKISFYDVLIAIESSDQSAQINLQNKKWATPNSASTMGFAHYKAAHYVGFFCFNMTQLM